MNKLDWCVLLFLISINLLWNYMLMILFLILEFTHAVVKDPLSSIKIANTFCLLIFSLLKIINFEKFYVKDLSSANRKRLTSAKLERVFLKEEKEDVFKQFDEKIAKLKLTSTFKKVVNHLSFNILMLKKLFKICITPLLCITSFD